MAGAGLAEIAGMAGTNMPAGHEEADLQQLTDTLLNAAAREQQRWNEYHNRLATVSDLVRTSQYPQAFALASQNGDSRISFPESILGVLREAGTISLRRLADGSVALDNCGYAGMMTHELHESSMMPSRIASFSLALNAAVSGKPDKYLEAYTTAQDLGLPQHIVEGAQRLYIEKCRPDIAGHKM